MEYIPDAVNNDLSVLEKHILQEAEDEYVRRGKFKRIYPYQEDPSKYLKYFIVKRPNNVLLATWEHLRKTTDYHRLIQNIS